MSQQPRVKPKLLLLRDILLEKTNEDHCLTVPEIIAELSKYGIKVERKTVYDDIETLINFGLDIVITKRSHSNAYYIGSRTFQTEELQVLADAVASSKFLSNRKSDELISKLQKLTDVYSAKDLKRSVYIEGRVKTFNEQIYYNINSIHHGINSKKKISFRYFSLDINKKKQYKNNGEKYYVSPYYLVWDNDNYYLVCFCEKHQNISRYRVDRMTNVEVSETASRVPEKDEADIAKSHCSTFGMYGGEKVRITLELDNDLIPVIIDRYGNNAMLRKKTDTKSIAVIEVQISPPFWGWLFQFGSKARIIEPQYAVKQAKQQLQEIINIY